MRWLVTILTRRVSLVEQELPSLPEHMLSLPVSTAYVLQIVACPLVLFPLTIGVAITEQIKQ
jgi:hypothetical protein